MGRSQKSKKVTWASGVNLRKVKLFLSDDTPSQVRIGRQDHLQAKPLSSSGGMGSDDNLPPGFEGAQPANPWTTRLSQIPLIKWKRPLKFRLNIDWQVVAGEESREIEIQNQREMRVLEAIYPRPSSIPPNPCELANVEGPTNDQHTPVVPITPIEDEDAAIDSTSYDTHNTPKPPNTDPMIISQPHQQQRLSHDITSRQPNNGLSVEPDIIAAAQAALTSVTGQANNNNNNNNMIDPGLLIKILSDPKMIEQLMSNRNVPSSSPASSSSAFHSTPAAGSRIAMSSASSPSSMQHNPPSTSNNPHYIPSPRPPQQQNNPFVNRRDPLPSHAPAPRPMMPPPAPFYPPRNTNMHPTLPPHLPDNKPVPGQSQGAPPPPVTKDMNYFKSLIQQHGGERRDSGPAQFGHPSTSSQEHHMTLKKQREMTKPKMMKPCIYFNSPKGCRNGSDCSFQHEIVSSAQQRVGSGIPEVQSTKRAKLNGEITGL
ncbi:hypothetical protein CASFOL_015925 [Castilleja foliolosa]|uniref:C3H1-type domain-containing protein n=1 Tax=Castilleja foliolosa TaxID=1961234 RepID=A0ABD3DH20_9LAMI